MRSKRAFTLIELVISISILLLIMAVAVPSLRGVLADRRLRRSVDGFTALVQQAQQLSTQERRSYLIVWGKDQISLRPESFAKGEAKEPRSVLSLNKNEAFTLKLPAALMKKPPAEWVFWSSGNCEPAIVSYQGPDGSWTAQYSPLTARSEFLRYATR